MFAGSGSARIAASSSASVAATSASASFQGTTTVSAVVLASTPGLEGIAWVASPEPACASRPSTCPW